MGYYILRAFSSGFNPEAVSEHSRAQHMVVNSFIQSEKHDRNRLASPSRCTLGQKSDKSQRNAEWIAKRQRIFLRKECLLQNLVHCDGVMCACTHCKCVCVPLFWYFVWYPDLQYLVCVQIQLRQIN